jgi:hypothetical protein
LYSLLVYLFWLKTYEHMDRGKPVFLKNPQKRESVNITGEYVSDTIRSYRKMAEPVMGPVMIMLIGGLAIAAGILLSSRLAPWVGMILAIGGVATLLVGMIMLFGLAHEKK